MLLRHLCLILFFFSISENIIGQHTICIGESIRIGNPLSSVVIGKPGFEYSWTSSPNDPSMSCTTCPAPRVTPEQTTTYTLNGLYSIVVTVTKPNLIIYGEDPGRNFGFDNWTYFNNPLNKGAPAINTRVPIISVAKGSSEDVNVAIWPANTHGCLFHKNGDTLNLETSSIQAPSGTFMMTNTGRNDGTNEEHIICVEARAYEENGTIIKHHPRPSRYDVWVFKPLALSVMARVVNQQNGAIGGTNWSSTDFSGGDNAQIQHVNEVFKQAAIEFQLVKLGPCDTNFDANSNNQFDYSGFFGIQIEPNNINNDCGDGSNYNMFLVDNTHTSSGAVGGFMNYGSNFGFSDISQAANPVRVMSHELGHGFTLRHAVGCGAGGPDTNVDNDNVMSYCGGDNEIMLRSYQWVVIRLEILSDGFY